MVSRRIAGGGTIAGRLTAADGATPVAGSAGLASLDEGFSMTRGTSATGEFSFTQLNPGRYRLLGQTPDGIAEREISLAPNQRFDAIVLALGAGHRISGVVTGLSPEDMKCVRIEIRRSSDVAGMYGDIAVDERGAYDYRGVQPGRVQVVADVTMRRQLSQILEMPADADATVNFKFSARCPSDRPRHSRRHSAARRVGDADADCRASGVSLQHPHVEERPIHAR